MRSKDGTRQTRGLPSFEPAERKTISRVVFDQIVTEIRRGSLRPGDRLPTEQELVTAFKVSRSSVREALRGLVTLGLIETRQGRALVALQAESPLVEATRNVDMDHLNRRALLDLLEVREALETKARALPHCTQHEARSRCSASCRRRWSETWPRSGRTSAPMRHFTVALLSRATIRCW